MQLGSLFSGICVLSLGICCPEFWDLIFRCWMANIAGPISQKTMWLSWELDLSCLFCSLSL